jgi:DNA polymerase IV
LSKQSHDAVRRAILHVDMDAFYASVEQHDRPELRGLPIIVGGGSVRGVVAAASYEVRRFGVHSAMPTRIALERCPEAILVSPRMSRYKEVSRQVFAVFEEFTPQIQGLSLDEAFLDITASLGLFGTAECIAQEIKTRITERTGLSASVGVSHNKLLAKIASDLNKPNGLCVISPEQVQHILDPLPIKRLPGIGPKTVARLEELSLHTFRDVRTATENTLRPIFGRHTKQVLERASGIDLRAVIADVAEKQISAEETFEQDISAPDSLHAELAQLTDRVCQLLRKRSLVTGTVSIKVRTHNFDTMTRSLTFKPASDATGTILAVAKDLLDRWWLTKPGARIRLLGVGLSGLIAAAQLDLFTGEANATTRSAVAEPARHAGMTLDPTLDRIRQKYGADSVKRASSLGKAVKEDGFKDIRRR